MTPFEKWFDGEFKQLVEKPIVEEPGILSSVLKLTDMSWDRKIAFAIWDHLGRPGADW